ncbi:uncharacterized protein ACNLHF_013929 [Anomaloglossus baeobatrachus]
MDSFSYCDIRSVFITKTINRIISPMAVQLCHLIISLESDGNKCAVMSDDLEQLAQELAEFTEHFANTSLRLGVECDDGILGEKIEKAAKSLLIIGKSILLSVQKQTIQPAVRKHQEELVAAAKNILMATLKILQLEDDAGVRKIHQAADWLLECLTYLQKADSISHLQTHFWEFSEALLLLNSLTENRILDLKDFQHQKHLAEKLQVLHKCVPMLCTATQSCIKHPCNDQIIDSKLYIFNQTKQTVQELKDLLRTDSGKHEEKKQGSFAQEFHNLLYILTDPKPNELQNGDFDFLVGAIIFYSMYVADCSRPNIKLQLVKHCQNLLVQRKGLCNHLKELQENTFRNVGLNQIEQCASMRIQLKHINEHLISSIFYQILDAFTVKDPLKKLLKAALKINKKASFHSEHFFASSAFHPLLQAFQNHMDQLLKISSLVLAQCSEEQIIDEIQSSVDCLCRVRDEVIALVFDINKSYYECKMFEKAQSIYYKWIQATESLIMSLDGILTVHQFLDLSIREIEENKYRCEKHLRSQEPEIFQHHAADLCDLAERVVQVVTRHVDQSKSPIFRNGLRVLVRQLETSVLETRTAMVNCVEKMSCFTTHSHFLGKANHLFQSLHDVQEGVSGSKHPDLLSPLRNEGGPIRHKVLTIDLNEIEESKEDNEKNLKEQHKTCLSYEGYLSKPVPSASIGKTIGHCESDENIRQVTDFQPLLGDLLSAIKTSNSKEIHTCSSLLHEICSIYMELVNDASLDRSSIGRRELKCKDTEALILGIVQFGKKENIEPALEIGCLIRTATFLSHHIEEMKTYLISLGKFWYIFSYNLFCNLKNTECINTNIELFNRLMQCFTRIVQSVREHLLDNHDDDLKFIDWSEKQDYVVDVQVQFSKCQAAANRLLTEALCGGMQSKNHKLEYVCIFWAISAQKLSTLLDEFICANKLAITTPTDWAQVYDREHLVLLCETSLWLQEATVLSIHNFREEKEQKKVFLLKEEMGSLTEAVLKLREDFNTTSPKVSISIDYVLLRIELMLKIKLLMDHLRKLYRGNRTLIQGIHLDICSFTSSDKLLAMSSFEKNVKSLTDNVSLVEETLKSTPGVTNKEDLLLLVDHLHSFTCDFTARSRQFLENQCDWELLTLEAMVLKWSAEADQLISHICSDTELEVSVLKFITQCLRPAETTAITMTDSAVFENDTSNVSKQTMNINVMEQRATTQYEQKNSTPKDQDTDHRDGSVTCYKLIGACSDEQSNVNGNDNFSSESKLISQEQSEADGTQHMKLSNRRISTVRRSMKVARSRRGIANNNEHNKNVTKKLKKTESDESPLEVNKEKNDEKDSTRENVHDDNGLEKNSLVSKELSTFAIDTFRAEKETTEQEAKNLKTHTLLTVVRKRVSQQEMQHETHKVLTELQKETLSQELRNEKANTTEKMPPISSQEKKDQQTNRDSGMVQSEGSTRNANKKITLNREIQNKVTHHKTSDQLIDFVQSLRVQTNEENLETRTSLKKKPTMCYHKINKINYPQELTNTKIQSYQKEGPTGLIKQVLTNTKAYMTSTMAQKETFNKDKITMDNRGQKTNKSDPKLETQNNHFICNKSTEKKCNETPQESKPKQKACPTSQPGINILMMADKKPEVVVKGNLSSTNVIIEHAKVNGTSLEDVRNVELHSQRFAKCLLAEEVETWEDETNTVVKITKEMATQMSYMIQYLDRKGPIKSPEQFIASAKCIASLGQNFVKFVGIMAKNCADERNTCELLCGMEQVQTISNQLNIISSVKAATGCDDYSAEDVLLKNAQNLIHSVLQTWRAAEAACIKSTENPIYSKEEEEVAAFCSQLRKKLLCHRAKDTEY